MPVPHLPQFSLSGRPRLARIALWVISQREGNHPIKHARGSKQQKLACFAESSPTSILSNQSNGSSKQLEVHGHNTSFWCRAEATWFLSGVDELWRGGVWRWKWPSPFPSARTSSFVIVACSTQQQLEKAELGSVKHFWIFNFQTAKSPNETTVTKHGITSTELEATADKTWELYGLT